MTEQSPTPVAQSFRRHVSIALPMIFGAAVLVAWAPVLSTSLAQALTHSPESGILGTFLLIGFLLASVGLVAICYNLTLGADATKPKTLGHWLARESWWGIVAVILVAVALRT
jgi:hypothetical protein